MDGRHVEGVSSLIIDGQMSCFDMPSRDNEGLMGTIPLKNHLQHNKGFNNNLTKLLLLILRL
jgi:hypothetical protein